MAAPLVTKGILMLDLNFLTIAEASKRIASGELSRQMNQAYIDRIDALGLQVNAFITLTADRAIEQARVAEAIVSAGRSLGPRHGIPFGLKNLYATAGILTTGHSRVCANYVQKEDAATVQMLYGTGANCLASSRAAHRTGADE
jgi:aspartyl-tRNA(Asn)/glutamyl-tRNA(Gln) amidotransferase subunit A